MGSAFIAATSGNGTSVTKPTGAAAGDYLLIVATDSSSSALTSTGFSSRGDQKFGSATNFGFAHWLVRQLDGTEGSTFTLSHTCAWAAVLYRGGGFPTPINPTLGAADSTSIPSRARPPMAGRVVHVWHQSFNGTTSITIPTVTGLTQRANQSDGSFNRVCVADEALAANSDVTRTATSSGQAWASMSFLLPDASVSLPYVAGSSSNNGNSTSPTIAAPSGVAVGDLIVIACTVTSASISAVPSGFTALDGPASEPGGTYTEGIYWGYKVATSGDVGATYTFTCGAQVWATAAVIVKHPGATPISVSGAGSHGTGASVPLVTRTAGGAGAMALSVVAHSSDPTGTNTLDAATTQGVSYFVKQGVNSGYGMVAISDLSAAPASTASLAATATLGGGGTPTWFTNTVLLALS